MTSPAPEQPAPPPWPRRSRLVLFLVLAVTGAIADLVTKAWVFSWPELTRGRVYWLWDGVAGFQRSLNEGALFGIGQGGSLVFAGVSVIAAIVIPVWLFRFGAARSLLLTVALGMVAGGVIGNLYDRVGLPQLTWGEFDPSRAGERVYAVRDWILVQANDAWRWPNFNVADSLLVCGAGLLFLHALLVKPDEVENEAAIGKRASSEKTSVVA